MDKRVTMVNDADADGLAEISVWGGKCYDGV
jgi:hypothetical protein